MTDVPLTSSQKQIAQRDEELSELLNDMHFLRVGPPEPEGVAEEINSSQRQIKEAAAERSKRIEDMRQQAVAFAQKQLEEKQQGAEASVLDHDDRLGALERVGDLEDATSYPAPPGHSVASIVDVGTSVYEKAFDIYDVDDDSVKIRSNVGAYVRIAGVHKIVTGTASEIAVASNLYIYIKIERDGSTASIETSASLENGDEDTEKAYIWYVPVSDGVIDGDNIIDMRGTPSWVAGA